ncbi:MAG: hypothetical protein ACI3XC_04885, partial [Phascolarctobacterium sp.]
MFKSHRYLTTAVLLSCSCLLAPFYAHAEEPGLHIKTEFDTTTVSEPINVSADNGIGVLVSAPGNTLNIESDITASGTNGTGIVVEANGITNITLQESKTIQALGDDGIAVSFIGNNEIAAMSNEDSASASCVTNFIVNGSLVGKKAAIYIAPTTHVFNINVQNGATLQGDIIADKTSTGPSTTLTFTGDASESSKISYNGNIYGNNSIFMEIDKTTLEYSGTAEVSSLYIESGATLLSGSANYIMSYTKEGNLRSSITNNGTLDLSDSKANTVVNITGNYTQNGKLLVEFNSDADSDQLQVKEGDAVIQGSITLTPQVDYYFNGQTIKLNPIVSVESGGTLTVYSGAPIINNISPVLKFTVAADDTVINENGKEYVCDYEKTQYIINVSRVEQGYQSVADDKISAGIGSAIDNEVNKPKEEQL